MPLPNSGVAWPPAVMSPITAKQREFDAWYSGDPAKLGNVYRVGNEAPVFDRVSQLRGGVSGALARMWWGKPKGNLFEKNTEADKLHIPLAADICQASADLLYAEAPTIASTDEAVAKELDLALETGMISTFAEGSEIGAALGDAYYRVTWDQDLPGEKGKRSFITSVHADATVPEFRWGVLVAVTFWWVIKNENSVVTRHLERHELDGQGNGIILHGVYEGNETNLGQLQPLADYTATEGLAKLVNDEGYISTESPGLAVVHVPNQTPQRKWRNNPVGRHLGRSDLDGVESELDKLDMVWSSWMRDIRLAKARLIVPNFMLSSGGPGQGAIFDTDQDIFTTLNAPPREDGKSDITPQQFEIRVQQHMDTAEALKKEILRTSGYGPQTFGDQGDVAQTATEVDARDRRSNLTRDRKIRNSEAPLKALIRKKLAVDAAIFRTGLTLKDDTDLSVQFPDATQESPADLAQTNALLFQAQSASVQTRVKIQHPDWDDKAVQAEAARILAEFGASVPDPIEINPGTEEQPPAEDEEKTPEELAAEQALKDQEAQQ